MFNKDKILKLTKLLLPNGTAYRTAIGSTVERFNKGLILSEARFLNDAISTFDSILADNSNFTIEDATAWEKRLGITSAETTSLENRKKAILQKYNYPNDPGARQHRSFIEKQLRDAGFDVRVTENNIGGVARPPEFFVSTEGTVYHDDDLLHYDDLMHYGLISVGTYHSDDLFHGDDIEHGGGFLNKVVNSIDVLKDSDFPVFDYSNTFFIHGDIFPQFGNVPVARMEEFRHMVLLLKPAQTVAYLFINYT